MSESNQAIFRRYIHAVFDLAGGGDTTISVVQIFRVRDGLIASLRDYYTPA